MNTPTQAPNVKEMIALRNVTRKRLGVLAALAKSEREDLMGEIMDEDRELLAALSKGQPSPEWQKDKARD